MSIFYLILCFSLFLFQTLEILLEYLKNPTSRRSALKVQKGCVETKRLLCHNKIIKIKDLTSVRFPRITLCHGEGGGYNHSKLEGLGYSDMKSFVIGTSQRHGNGWITQDKTAREVFEAAYSEPRLEMFINNGSYIKLNGTRYTQRHHLSWFESPMSYEGGRCLTLNFTQTSFSKTAIILNLNYLNFTEEVKLDLTITGWINLKSIFSRSFFLLRSTQGVLPTRYFELLWGQNTI